MAQKPKSSHSILEVPGMLLGRVSGRSKYAEIQTAATQMLYIGKEMLDASEDVWENKQELLLKYYASHATAQEL